MPEDNSNEINRQQLEDAENRGLVARVVYAEGVKHYLRRFTYAHLPEHLQARSRYFCELAESLSKDDPSLDTVDALRSLLLAKNAAARSLDG